MGFDRIKEAFGQVAKDEARKLSIVQETMRRSTDCLRCIIELAGWQGGVAMSNLRSAIRINWHSPDIAGGVNVGNEILTVALVIFGGCVQMARRR